MSHRSSGLYKVFAVVLAIPFLWRSETARADQEESKKIFSQRCTACHTFGKGVKVGPDLRGVTERRSRAWLMKFIRSSQTVIASGDPIAVELFAQFKQQQMPDWTDLSEAQIGALLDWLAADGPEQRAMDSRSAESASAAELERGRQLFWGEATLASGGVACSGCHELARRGGTLGPELGGVYAAYGDGALTRKLQQPCVVRWPEAAGSMESSTGLEESFATSEQVFAIKAYLWASGSADGAASGAVTKTPPPRRWAAPQLAAGVVPAARPATMGLQGRGELAFRWLPYAALLLGAGGVLLRYAVARRRRADLASAAQAAWRELGSGTAWRIGVAATLALHLLLVLAPGAVIAWGSAPWRLMIFEGGSALFAVLALVGWAVIAVRLVRRGHETRLVSEARRAELGDLLFWGALGVALASGLALAAMHRWASLWSAATITPYLRSLLSPVTPFAGAPMSGLVEPLPILARAHLISMFALLALLPLSRAADVMIGAIDRVVLLATRPLELGRRKLAAATARLSLARWLWPEED